MQRRSQKTQIYPNKKQIVALKRTVGVTRFAYNWGLERWRQLYDKGLKHSAYELSKLWTEERPEWSKEVSTCAPRHALVDVQSAYDALFRKKRYRRVPRYRKKGKNDSFYLTNEMAPVAENRIRLGKIGWVRMAEPLRYNDAHILSCVVSCKADKWFVCINCEVADTKRSKSTDVVGVDVGIKHWAATSDGLTIDSPESLRKLYKQLASKQRKADRKLKGSENKKKAYLKVSKLYRRIDNIKKDAIHKFTATVAKNHGTVVLEDLSVHSMYKGAARKKALSKGINNSCMREIQRQLMYKCNNYIKVDRFFPSSKTCSHCGSIKADLSLSDRTYHCRVCGLTIDRDLNAATNLLKEGLRKLSTVGHTVKDCGATPRD